MKHRSRFHLPDDFRRPWIHSERPLPRLVVRPLERFLDREEGSASLLMLAAVVALVWANFGGETYEHFWSSRVAIEVGPFSLEEDLRHTINELLMAVFFFVVSLEVKREYLFGALRDRRSAAVPIAAALGTMVGAATTYLALNIGGGGNLSGWAIPISTDIAFSLGALGLVGSKAPRELRAFMLTLAVVDDLATILIIAFFFSSGLSLAWLLAALGVVLVIVASQRVGIRSLAVYVLYGGALWLAIYNSGVHATIAGVIVGFLTPAWAFHSRRATSRLIATQLGEIAESDPDTSEGALLETAQLAQEAVSPLVRRELLFQPWSSFLILPVFALANAGVPVSVDVIGDALSSQVGLGVFFGLVIGSPLGGFLAAWSIVRFGPARMPAGLDWPAIGAVTPLKGIGFTVAIFITGLTFEGELRDQATLAVLVASVAAAFIGITALFARHVIASRTNGRS